MRSLLNSLYHRHTGQLEQTIGARCLSHGGGGGAEKGWILGWQDERALCLSSLTPLAAASPAEERLERDYFMSAEEALGFGIIDEVIQQRPQATPL